MPDKREILIQADRIRVDRGGTEILHGVSLEIDAGAPFGIVGESGSGKSTLLFSVAGLLPLSAGKAWISGLSVGELSPRRRAGLIGIVFQDFQLFPHLSALENVLLAPNLRGSDVAQTRRIADELLSDLRISELSGRRPHELSGGQKQRVAIARALVLQPRVLFLDEPSASLDSRTTEELADLLLRLNAHTQIVVVSHDGPFLKRCCSRGVRMENGNVAGDLLPLDCNSRN